MNRCWSCQEEFGYWEIWRSWWKVKGASKIRCPSCGERNSVLPNRGMLPQLLIMPPSAIIPYLVFPTADFFFKIVMMGFLYALFSFLVPLFPLYGRKP